MLQRLKSSLLRLRTAIKVSWDSSVSFSSFGTALVTLVILPLFDILYAVSLGDVLNSGNLTRIAYASVFVSSSIAVASGVLNIIVASQNRGVFSWLMLANKIDWITWVSAGLIPACTSFITGTFNLLGIGLLSRTISPSEMFATLGLLIFAIMVGLLLGIFASGVSLWASDPYLGATLLSVLLPLLTGVVVPLDLYPEWLKAIGLCTPLSHILISFNQGDVSSLSLFLDVLCACTWALVGLVLIRFAKKKAQEGEISFL